VGPPQPQGALGTIVVVVSDESSGAVRSGSAAPAEPSTDQSWDASATDSMEPGVWEAPDELELGPTQDPVAVARRRHGAAGAMLAAGMFGVDMALGRKPREDIPVVVAANDEPGDVDTEGIEIAVDEHTRVVAPALPRPEPGRRPRRARRSRRAG
jgi:hypothetical protein